MLILDADIVIELERGNSAVWTALQKARAEHPESIYITSAVYAEVCFGLLSSSIARNTKAISNLEIYEVLDFDKMAAKIFSMLKFYLEKKGRQIPVFDLITAATVIKNGATLVSNDKHFKSVPNLKLITLEI